MLNIHHVIIPYNRSLRQLKSLIASLDCPCTLVKLEISNIFRIKCRDCHVQEGRFRLNLYGSSMHLRLCKLS